MLDLLVETKSLCVCSSTNKRGPQKLIQNAPDKFFPETLELGTKAISRPNFQRLSSKTRNLLKSFKINHSESECYVEKE